MCTIKGTECRGRMWQRKCCGEGAVMAVPFKATMPGRRTTLEHQP